MRKMTFYDKAIFILSLIVMVLAIATAVLVSRVAHAFAGATITLVDEGPTWVVADNPKGDDRPVYSIPDHKLLPDRAPENQPCGASTRTDQTGTRQWREWAPNGTVIGEVYCTEIAAAPPPPVPDTAQWVVAEGFFGVPSYYYSPVFAMGTVPGAAVKSHSEVARARVGEPCTVSTRSDQTGRVQWRLYSKDGVPLGETLCRVVDATDPAPVVPDILAIRVNAAGDQFTDPAGHVWSKDTGFNTGKASVDLSRVVTGTKVPTLYHSERWDDKTDPAPMTYTFAVPDGWYTVTLYFTETNVPTQKIGGRVFSVTLDGDVVEKDLDIFAKVGANKAYEPSFKTLVTNGKIVIGFTSTAADNPEINGIQIIGE